MKSLKEKYVDLVEKRVLSNVKSAKDLFELCTKPSKKTKEHHLLKMYNGIELYGSLLEIGFGQGNCIYWINKFYRKIEKIDGFDFNPSLTLLIPLIEKLIPKANLWIGDSSKINEEDNHYDFINCCDVFEHLPSDIYFKTLSECYRVLKPGGYIGVFVGRSKSKLHIRVVPAKQTETEMITAGFQKATDHRYMKLKE